ncbi:MAG: hypothetical protein H7237_03595 [Alkalinema sp. FL-bin-369]|nr:hypothetical protein [Leptolyngbyaceae cyanobacterium LF-bin-369]
MKEVLTESQVLEMARQFLISVYLHKRQFSIVSVDNLAVKISREAIVEAEVANLISDQVDHHAPKEVVEYIRQLRQETALNNNG